MEEEAVIRLEDKKGITSRLLKERINCLDILPDPGSLPIKPEFLKYRLPDPGPLPIKPEFLKYQTVKRAEGFYLDQGAAYKVEERAEG